MIAYITRVHIHTHTTHMYMQIPRLLKILERIKLKFY